MRLIDADALIPMMRYATIDSDIGVFPIKIGFDAIVKVINAQPTIDAAPVKHGMWLPKHHYIAGYEFVSGHICSECGNDALNAEGDDFLTEFCPNCGARMVGMRIMRQKAGKEKKYDND